MKRIINFIQKQKDKVYFIWLQITGFIYSIFLIHYYYQSEPEHLIALSLLILTAPVIILTTLSLLPFRIPEVIYKNKIYNFLFYTLLINTIPLTIFWLFQIVIIISSLLQDWFRSNIGFF